MCGVFVWGLGGGVRDFVVPIVGTVTAGCCKWTYLNGIVHSHRKTEKRFLVTTTAVRCVHHEWKATHPYEIQVSATHASTWAHRYSSPLQWSVPLGQRGHVTMVRRILCTKCTLHSNQRLTVCYSNTQNDFSPGAAIFSLHTLASPSGRNMNYDACWQHRRCIIPQAVNTV